MLLVLFKYYGIGKVKYVIFIYFFVVCFVKRNKVMWIFFNEWWNVL